MTLMQSPPGATTVIDGQRFLYFVGTGYLGLQGHPEVIRAVCEAAEQYGIASATSRTGFGNTPPVLEVERLAAEFFAADDAFYFMSGYVGNHILALLLGDTFDALFVDEMSHYCVMEAARLSGKPVVTFAHADPDSLRTSLKKRLEPSQRPLVASDGVFAARGTIAPVAAYYDVLAGYPGALLCLDDAHAVGVLGEHGRGTFEHAGLFDRGVNVRAGGDAEDTVSSGPGLFCCGTLSKAMGGFGGITAGSQAFIDRLKSTSPYYGGASAPPVPIAAATACAIRLVMSEPSIRQRLSRNVHLLKTGLRAMGLDVDDTPVPIICLTLGNAQNMRRIQKELMSRGICIAYMAAYSGLSAAGALRIAPFATHTEEMIQQLLDALRPLV